MESSANIKTQYVKYLYCVIIYGGRKNEWPQRELEASSRCCYTKVPTMLVKVNSHSFVFSKSFVSLAYTIMVCCQIVVSVFKKQTNCFQVFKTAVVVGGPIRTEKYIFLSPLVWHWDKALNNIQLIINQISAILFWVFKNLSEICIVHILSIFEHTLRHLFYQFFRIWKPTFQLSVRASKRLSCDVVWSLSLLKCSQRCSMGLRSCDCWQKAMRLNTCCLSLDFHLAWQRALMHV